MPYVIGRPPKRILAVVATTVGMLVTASPALANSSRYDWNGYQVPTVASAPASPTASCPSVVSSPLLSSLGDNANYSPLQEATFEGTAADWSLNNATVVNDNEPWYVVSSTDSNALQIGAGGSATSPTFCVDSTFPSYRFFAESQGNGPQSSLNVYAKFTLANGYSGMIPAASLSSGNYSSWQVTPSLPLGSVLQPGQTVTVQFVFAAGSGSAWEI
ncbi:MAG TPA: hypothetical protein VGG87_06215, partial [Solirubrobacteraceae bacterium]